MWLKKLYVLEEEPLYTLSDYVEPKEGRDPGPRPVVLDSYLALASIAANSSNLSPSMIIFSGVAGPAGNMSERSNSAGSSGSTDKSKKRRESQPKKDTVLKRKKSYREEALDSITTSEEEEEEKEVEFLTDNGELVEATLPFVIASITSGAEGKCEREGDERCEGGEGGEGRW